MLEYPGNAITARTFHTWGPGHGFARCGEEDEEFCDDGSVHVRVRVETREAARRAKLRDATQESRIQGAGRLTYTWYLTDLTRGAPSYS